MPISLAKIIKIEDDLIFIGLDDGSIKKVNKSFCNFSPDINDEVEIYESEGCIVVNKINTTKKKNNATDQKIDINVNNNSPTGSPVYVANNKKAVNKVIYCVLALLLGYRCEVNYYEIWRKTTETKKREGNVTGGACCSSARIQTGCQQMGE